MTSGVMYPAARGPAGVSVTNVVSIGSNPITLRFYFSNNTTRDVVVPFTGTGSGSGSTTVAGITDAQTPGKNLLLATTQAAARTAIAAGTSDQNLPAGTLTEGSNGTVTALRGWAPDVLNSVIDAIIAASPSNIVAGTLAEATNGSITVARSWTPQILNQAITAVAPVGGGTDLESVRDDLATVLDVDGGITMTVDDTANKIFLGTTGLATTTSLTNAVFSKAERSQVYRRWTEGDPTPTRGAGELFEILLSATATLPSFASAGDIVDRIAGATTTPVTAFDLKLDFAGIANGTALVTGGATGTGDTPTTLGTVTGTGTSVVQTGDTTLTPAVEFTISTSTAAFQEDITARSLRRVGAWLRTGASWSTGSASMFTFMDTANTVARLTLLNPASGQTAPRWRILNSNGDMVREHLADWMAFTSKYWVEIFLNQNATATLGTIQVKVSDFAGAVRWDSGVVTDDITTPFGFGTTHNRLKFGPYTSTTVTYRLGHFRATNDMDPTHILKPAAA